MQRINNMKPRQDIYIYTVLYFTFMKWAKEFTPFCN